MSNQSKMYRDSSVKGNFASISESPQQNSDTESYHSRMSTASDVSQAMSFEKFKGANSSSNGPSVSTINVGTMGMLNNNGTTTPMSSESFPPAIQASFITNLCQQQQQMPIQQQPHLSYEQQQQPIQQTSASDINYRGSVDSTSLPEAFIMY